MAHLWSTWYQLDSLIHCGKMAMIVLVICLLVGWLLVKAMEVTGSSSSRLAKAYFQGGGRSALKFNTREQTPMFKHFFFQFYCDIIYSTFQLSASIMFANDPSAKASHMATDRHKRCRNRLQLIMGKAAKLHCIQTDMHTGMGRICDNFCILPHCRFFSFRSP